MTSPVREILSYTLRREGEEDIYFQYSSKSFFGEQEISACTHPQIGKNLGGLLSPGVKKEIGTDQAPRSA